MPHSPAPHRPPFGRALLRRLGTVAAMVGLAVGAPVAGALVIEDGPDGTTLRGSPQADRLYGNAGDDRLVGGGGDDTLLGGSGRDVLIGGAGNDRLVGGPGEDVLIGGPGDDVIDARDGVAEEVDCGPGDDLAILDHLDTPIDCETIDLPHETVATTDRASARLGVAAGLENAAHCNDPRAWVECIFERSDAAGRKLSPRVRLRDVILPGANEAGSYAIPLQGARAVPGCSPHLNGLGLLNSDAAAALTRTQDLAPQQAMLRAGVRYFDLRVGRLGDDPVLCNLMAGASLERFLEEPGEGLTETARLRPREIVLIDLRDIAGHPTDQPYADRLAFVVAARICPRAVPVRTPDGQAVNPQELTVEDVWQTGRPWVVLAEGDWAAFMRQRGAECTFDRVITDHRDSDPLANPISHGLDAVPARQRLENRLAVRTQRTVSGGYRVTPYAFDIAAGVSDAETFRPLAERGISALDWARRGLLSDGPRAVRHISGSTPPARGPWNLTRIQHQRPPSRANVISTDGIAATATSMAGSTWCDIPDRVAELGPHLTTWTTWQMNFYKFLRAGAWCGLPVQGQRFLAASATTTWTGCHVSGRSPHALERPLAMSGQPERTVRWTVANDTPHLWTCRTARLDGGRWALPEPPRVVRAGQQASFLSHTEGATGALAGNMSWGFMQEGRLHIVQVTWRNPPADSEQTSVYRCTVTTADDRRRASGLGCSVSGGGGERARPTVTVTGGTADPVRRLTPDAEDGAESEDETGTEDDGGADAEDGADDEI